MYSTRKYYWGHYFYVSYWRRGRHFTLSSEPRECLTACSTKRQREYVHFSVILRPWVLVQPRESNPRPPAQHLQPISVLCIHPDFCDMIRRLWFDRHDSTERLPSSKQERTWGFCMRIYGGVWFIINICMEVRKRKQQIAFLQVPLLCQKFAACIGDMAMWADNEGEEDKESWPVSVYACSSVCRLLVDFMNHSPT